jgi:outer membrane protein, heavy metal efflux system
MQVQTALERAVRDGRTRITRLGVFCALALAVGGCIRYEAKPLDVEGRFESWRKRAALMNPDIAKIGDGVMAVGEDRGPVDVNKPWDLERLGRVAVRCHPNMMAAAAHIWTVEAGQITAGEMPNPSVSISPTYVTNAGQETPWVVGWSFDIPIETAGKRGLRLQVARGQTEVALMEYAQASWEARSRVREALADYLLTQEETDLDKQIVDSRQRYVGVLEARLKGGEASQPEVNTARIDLLAARGEMLAAEGRLEEARAKLAASLGMPTAGLEGVKLVWPDVEVCPALTEEQKKDWQAAGLLNRLDLRGALKEYATAEAELELEIAKQYPDVHIGPGYEFDQGLHKWTIGLSVDLPILNQNQGAIAEAYAKRTEQGVKVLGLQIQALGELEGAEARYSAALKEGEDAAAQVEAAQKLLDAANKALTAGEEDRLTVTGLEVQVNVAKRQRLETMRRAREAAGAIEDAIQRPLKGTDEHIGGDADATTKGAAL